jgi:hypothetical protein
MAGIVATADPTTGSVLIELDRRLVVDDFNRVVAAGSWGSASLFGGAYTLAGGTVASDYLVNGTVGQMILATASTTRNASLLSGLADVDAQASFLIPVAPTGASIDARVAVRRASGASYGVRVSVGPSTTASISIVYIDTAGTIFVLAGPTVIEDFTVSASNALTARITASGQLLQAWAWPTASAEPVTPMLTTRHDVLTSGSVGVAAIRNTGNLNGSQTVSWDNFTVEASVEPLNLWRHTPDGEEVLVRGSGFFTAAPDEQGVFWDNEAPFDVDVFYTLRSGDSTTDMLTSNTVNLDSDGLAWIRDPYIPAYNIAFETEGDIFDFCDDEPRIMFAGLAGKSYVSASGIFEIIDAQRPDTVAQIRKRYGSALYLISKELEDVESIEAIFAGGYPVLLSLPPVYGFGLPYGTDWVTVIDIDSAPMGADQRLPARTWSLPFRLSSTPTDIDTGNTGGNGIGAGDATFDVLAASVIGTTFNSLAATALTFDDIAAGTGY